MLSALRDFGFQRQMSVLLAFCFLHILVWGFTSQSGGVLAHQPKNGADSISGLHFSSTSRKLVSSTDLIGFKHSAAAGVDHACGINSHQQIACWGNSEFGQTGVELEMALTPGPFHLQKAGTVAQVAVGEYHGCLLFQDGGFACWGDNTFGQAGVSSDRCLQSPEVHSAPGSPYSDICVDDTFTCARSPSLASCWGDNTVYQVSSNASKNIPEKEAVPSAPSFTTLTSAAA